MSREASERVEDERLLGWVARFRFVTAAEAAERFGRSDRRVRSRLARLESNGWVVSQQLHGAAPKLYAVSGPGAGVLGTPRRRPPRWETQVTHELQVVALVARLELARPELTILTERDCRAREAQGQARYSVGCLRDGTPARRWPDVVIEGAGRRAAVEIELAAKTTERLRAILLAYLTDRVYNRLQVRCGSQVLARRMTRLVGDLGGTSAVSVTLV
jgi:hypothetical protein